MPNDRIWNAIAHAREQVTFAQEEAENTLRNIKLSMDALTAVIKEEEENGGLSGVQRPDHVEPDGGRDEDPTGRSRDAGRGSGTLPDSGGSSEPDRGVDPGGASGASASGPPHHLSEAARDLAGTRVLIQSGHYAGHKGVVEAIQVTGFGNEYASVKVEGVGTVSVRIGQVSSAL